MAETPDAAGSAAEPLASTPTSPSAAEPAGGILGEWEQERRGLRAEAKDNRLKLREAESERDDLRTRLDASEQREVERMIADRLQVPSDFWLTTNIASLRTDDGQLDSDKIGESIERVLEQRPHWRKTGPADFSPGVRKSLPVRERSLGQAFKDSLLGRG